MILGVLASGSNTDLPAKAIWVPLTMLGVSFLQFFLRYINDDSFELKGIFLFSAIFTAVWFLSLTCSL